jgi:riboflavin-specific deaminase-like protein
MAMSADGKIATSNRRVASFGSQADHAHLLALRATVDAVMSGARTLDADRITLGPGPARYRRLRLKNGLSEYNLRVIVSGRGTIDPQAEIFRHRFSAILLLTTRRAAGKRLARLRALVDETKFCGETALDLAEGLRWLRREHGVHRLLCEGGGELNFSMLQAGLVDEVHLTICPRILGGRNAPTLAEGAGFEALADAAQFILASSRRVGDELFLAYRAAA